MTPQMVEAVARVIPAPAILFGQNPKMMVRDSAAWETSPFLVHSEAHHKKMFLQMQDPIVLPKDGAWALDNQVYCRETNLP